MDTTTVSAELEPQLRLYRRLFLARQDLHEASAIIEETLRANFPFPRYEEPGVLHLSLTTALAIAYARPFVNSRGNATVADRTVPGSLLRVYTRKERALHEVLIDFRNREIAHTDADILELSLQLFPAGDGSISRATRHPYRRAELRALQKMIDKLLKELERRCAELRRVLPLEVWL
ncbi:hypothetical protein AB4Y44_25955 [Paraburkholderia sp. BR10937]|uniref:hypothetical protein n=1 Tax=Paraburkholderia sp. BR10937 TaxID=3236994 RepID=UPI0034D1F192